MQDSNDLKGLYSSIGYLLSRQSIQDSNLAQSKDKMDDAIKNSTIVNDAYGNSLASIGTNDKVQSFTTYGFDNDTLNFSLWLALYNDSWVFRRAIDKPADDEIACGIKLNLNENADKVLKELSQHKQQLCDLLKWGALFGGSIAVMMFDNIDFKDMAKPMSKKKIKQAKRMRLYVTDRWYGCAADTDDVVSNMASLDFGKPKFYTITFADGKQARIHHDYIIRYEHRTAPNLIKKGQLQGWGYAEGAHIIHELSRDDQLKASIQSLVNKSLIEVIKMPGMRGVFLGADEDNQKQLTKRLEMVNWARTYNSLTFLDIADEYQQNTFGGLGGLSDLLLTNMRLISAALEMTGILYGDLDGGFSADTVAMKRYASTIKTRCDAWVRPVHEKILTVIYMMYDINDKIDFEYESLLKEEEEVLKIESINKMQSLLSGLIGDGILTPQLAAKSMQKFTTDGLVDLGLTDEEISKIDNTEEMEDFDFEEKDIESDTHNSDFINDSKPNIRKGLFGKWKKK